MLSLKLLGGARVDTARGRAVGPGAQRHHIALLALLATAPGHSLSRDKLVGLLWPEKDTRHGRNLLNVSVYTIRKTLADDALVSTSDGIELNIAQWCVDVVEFEIAHTAGELERATSVYAGPFLDGFFLAEAPEFDRWQARERDRLARRYAAALQTLADVAEAQGDGATAAEWWHRLTIHDPLDSRAALGLMRALARSGNRAAALQHANAHTALLRDELGVEPTRDIAAFAATLSVDPDAVRTALAEPLPVAPSSDGRPQPPSRRKPIRHRAGRRAALIVLPLAVAGYAVLGGRVGGADADFTSTRGEAPSMAVLPFVNIGNDTASEYFVDGMTDELTAELQRVPGLRVLSRRSAFAFKDSIGVDVRRIGRQLGVGSVLEGTVRGGPGRLRVTAQLTNVRDGRALWSATFERDGRDIFAVQDEIVRATAGALGVTARGDQVSRAAMSPRSLEARELYLRGRFVFHDASSERGLRQAITFYERALAVDSSYALPWAGIAEVWAWLADFHVAPNVAYPNAKAAALRALALDSTLAEAHALLGAVHAAYDWDFTAAQQRARHAVRLNPNSANVLVSAAFAYADGGSLDSASVLSRRARELDPLGALTGYVMCWMSTASGRYEQAIEEANEMLALDPGQPLAFWAIGEALSAQGRHAEALEFFRRAAPVGPMARADVARTLAALGRRDEARRLVRELEREGEHRYVSPVSIAAVYVHLREHDTAFRWLERGYQIRSAEITTLPLRREWDPVRNDPRFQAIVRRSRGGA